MRFVSYEENIEDEILRIKDISYLYYKNNVDIFANLCKQNILRLIKTPDNKIKIKPVKKILEDEIYIENGKLVTNNGFYLYDIVDPKRVNYMNEMNAMKFFLPNFCSCIGKFKLNSKKEIIIREKIRGCPIKEIITEENSEEIMVQVVNAINIFKYQNKGLVPDILSARIIKNDEKIYIPIYAHTDKGIYTMKYQETNFLVLFITCTEEDIGIKDLFSEYECFKTFEDYNSYIKLIINKKIKTLIDTFPDNINTNTVFFKKFVKKLVTQVENKNKFKIPNIIIRNNEFNDTENKIKELLEKTELLSDEISISNLIKFGNFDGDIKIAYTHKEIKEEELFKYIVEYDKNIIIFKDLVQKIIETNNLLFKKIYIKDNKHKSMIVYELGENDIDKMIDMYSKILKYYEVINDDLFDNFKNITDLILNDNRVMVEYENIFIISEIKNIDDNELELEIEKDPLLLNLYELRENFEISCDQIQEIMDKISTFSN